MTGSTLNSYTTAGITIGSAAYPSPLTITTDGTINTTGKYGVSAGKSVSSPILVNNGDITASTGVDLYSTGADVTNTGIILGNSDAGIILFNDGTVDNTATITGELLGVDLHGGGYLNNQGNISGGTVGVELSQTGTVINTGEIETTYTTSNVRYAISITAENAYVTNSNTAALITSAKGGVYIKSAAGVVVNAGTIESSTAADSGIFLRENASTYTGTIQNNGTAALISGFNGIQVFGGQGAVTNTGTITGVSRDGVQLNNGGTVNNTSTASAIYGERDGINIAGAGSVNNAGTITGNVGDGITISAAGTVSNAGTIIGKEQYGIDIAAAGSVSNTGSVTGVINAVRINGTGYLNNQNMISGGKTGVDLNAGGSLVNTGSISGTNTGVRINGIGYVNNQKTISGGYAGVNLNGGTIINSGSIIATISATTSYYAASINGASAYVTNSTGALISGPNGGLAIGATTAVVINDGTIESGTGAGSAVFIDTSGSTGTANVANNGTTALISGYNGVLINNPQGSVLNSGTIIGISGEGVILEQAGTVSNTGTRAAIFGNSIGVDIAGTATKLINAGTISGKTDAVALYGTTSNLLIADVGAKFVGGVETNSSAANTLELAQGPAAGHGALDGIGSQFNGFGTIDFDAGTAWTLGGNSAGLASGQIINGFTFGDTIDLAPSIQSLVARRLDSAALTESFANNTLTLFSGGVEFATLNLNELSTTNSENFEVFSDGNGGTDIVMDMPCFCTGTKILTPTGQVNVEDLQVGDTVITVRDNGPVTGRVTWTGRRSLDIARHPNPASMHPIRIIAGAFAPGVPERDLRVSPHHALYIDGALMEAISLVNDATVIQEFETRFVTYHHIALETHDVILAEGMPAETYLETGSRNMFEGESSIVLHPNFQILGDADFCAPMIRAGAKLEAARARLLARAAFLGFTQTDDIDLTAQPRHGRA